MMLVAPGMLRIGCCAVRLKELGHGRKKFNHLGGMGRLLGSPHEGD